MSSRTEQREAARAERIANEEHLARAARQRQRLWLLGGLVAVAATVVVVAIAVSGGGSKAEPARRTSLRPASRT